MVREEVTKEFLEEEYITNHRSLNEIAKMTGWCYAYIQRRAKIYGIQLRDFETARKEACFKANFKGFGEITGTYWGGIKYRAKRRNIPFNVSIEYAWELFLKQNRRCALTGLEITLPRNAYEHEHGLKTASFDRIDSDGDYTPGNVQWVHKEINLMKLAMDETRFIELCQLVSRHKGEDN